MSVVGLLLEDMDQLLDDMKPFEPPLKRRAVGVTSIACDVVEDKSKNLLVIEAELPGALKENISVTIEKDVLTIEAVKENRKHHDESRKRHVKEIRHGPMRRSFKLPSEVLSETSRCSFVDGVLRIELTKSPSSCARKLDIL